MLMQDMYRHLGMKPSNAVSQPGDLRFITIEETFRLAPMIAFVMQLRPGAATAPVGAQPRREPLYCFSKTPF